MFGHSGDHPQEGALKRIDTSTYYIKHGAWGSVVVKAMRY